MQSLPILSEVIVNRERMFSPFEGPSEWHRFDVDGTHYLLVVDGSRIYSLPDDVAEKFDAVARETTFDGDGGVVNLMRELGICDHQFMDEKTPREVETHALSLAIAQKCNLGCTYCYAEGGDFGGAAKNMTAEVAFAAVDRLIENRESGERVNLAFLGGEPLVNRPVLQDATRYAAKRAARAEVEIGFSITTNGTLLTQEDAQFFEQHGFAVTISLDGIGNTHDALRPFKSGRGSFEQVMERVAPLLIRQRNMQVSARVTVTPHNLELPQTLQSLIDIGFHSVGFSPMLASPNGQGEMQSDHLKQMLAQMISCGRMFEVAVAHGRRFPFANMVNAMREIHRGTHRPYPRGAGAGYLGVSAEGGFFACHRFVDDPTGAMGNVDSGVDKSAQRRWMEDRHVHFQQPCSGCWARYLCGGGCHHEVIKRGRPACEYVRAWLDYCLKAYMRLKKTCPQYFNGSNDSSSH